MKDVIITFDDGHTISAVVDPASFASREVQCACRAAHIKSVKIAPPMEQTITLFIL